jgi:pimeloyl-ACP methyl ester carboxylesterase
MQEEPLLIRIHGDPSGPTLVYLPGIHGDWSMIGDFRRQVLPHYCFVEFTYPRTKTWTLQQYAQAVLERLEENGITHGWIIAESFGSQVGWMLLELQRAHPEKFTPEGLILAGGFVRHINLCGITLFGKNFRIPLKKQFSLLRFFGRRILKRCLKDPLVREEIMEFKERRSQLDRDAVWHRLELALENDLRPIAATTEIPVFCLSGLIDLAVIFPHTHYWLWRYCPGYHGAHLLINWELSTLGSDHHVLGHGKRSFRVIDRWIRKYR